MSSATPTSAIDFWFKVVAFLQTNWALIEEHDDRVVIVFVQDASVIFDRITVPNRDEAERQLLLNGFRRFAEDPKAGDFLSPPDPPFEEGANPIYSSGEYWRTSGPPYPFGRSGGDAQ